MERFMAKKQKVTLKSIKEVKAKLTRSSVSRLSPAELCVYLSHRLIELINNESVVDDEELLYRLCEVGPGNLRFDPLTVGVFLESKMCRDLFDKNSIERKGSWFYAKNGDMDEAIFKIKHKISEVIKENIASKNCLKLLKCEVSKIIRDFDYDVESCLINDKKQYIEFILTSTKLKMRILFRFYNSNEWIYPFSWHLWELFREAGKNRCVPVLVAPRIHGSCFPLFKAIGILARATYGLFSEKNLDEIKEKNLDASEKALLSFQRIAPGKIYCLSHAVVAKDLEGFKQLLVTVVPAYFESCKKRFDQTSKKIGTHFNDKFQYLLDPQSSKLDVMERIARIKDILTLKLGHLNALQDVVKRQEDLIKELG